MNYGSVADGRSNGTALLRGRKGVSPLIAAVLLIAFTMAVAAILTAWVTTFTQEQTEAVSNQSEQLVECSYAGVSVYDANYDTGSSTLDVTIANTGTVDLLNVTVYAFTDASVQDQDSLTNLDAGSLDTASISGISQPDRVRVATGQCPSVTAEESDISTS